LALSLPAHADVKPVLLILTSHGALGDTGKKQGFTVEMASIEGGERPVNLNPAVGDLE
jgi:hypothetical protein